MTSSFCAAILTKRAASTGIIYLVHLYLRPIIIRLLSQIHAFINFVRILERPILQPESRFLPMGMNRDPRATIVARERAEGIAGERGIDLVMWGKALEGVEAGQFTFDS